MVDADQYATGFDTPTGVTCHHTEPLAVIGPPVTTYFAPATRLMEPVNPVAAVHAVQTWPGAGGGVGTVTVIPSAILVGGVVVPPPGGVVVPPVVDSPLIAALIETICACNPATWFCNVVMLAPSPHERSMRARMALDMSVVVAPAKPNA